MTPAGIVRLARPEDRQVLIEIQRRASLAVEKGTVLRRLMEEPEHIGLDDILIDAGQVVLAEAAGRPVGFASFILEDKNVELDGLFVDPGHWRKGIGRMIIDAVEHVSVARGAARIRVVAGEGAVPFYRSLGFVVVGKEKTQLGPVASVMTKAIICRS